MWCGGGRTRVTYVWCVVEEGATYDWSCLVTGKIIFLIKGQKKNLGVGEEQR